MVDKNIPWRLVANIAAPEMLEYSKNFGITSTNEILSLYYDRTDNIYFNKFRLYLHKLYHDVIINDDGSIKYINEFEDCNGRTIVHKIKPTMYSIEQLERILDDKKLMKIYFDIRTMEEEKKLSEPRRIDCIGIALLCNLLKAMTAHYLLLKLLSITHLTTMAH